MFWSVSSRKNGMRVHWNVLWSVRRRHVRRVDGVWVNWSLSLQSWVGSGNMRMAQVWVCRNVDRG